MTDTVKSTDTSEGRSAVIYYPLDKDAMNDSRASREEFLVSYADWGSGIILDPPSLAGMGTRTYPISGRLVERWRERSPFDNPPGEGYKTLAMAGKFVANKPYFHGKWTFDTSNIWRTNYAWGEPIGVYPSMAYIDQPNNYVDWASRFGDASHEARQAAITNLYGSLHRRQDLALGVLLAEFKESLDLLGKSLLTIARIIRALKKGRVGDALAVIGDHFDGGVSTRKRLLNRRQLNVQRRRAGQKPMTKRDYAASTWLELQFGWLPIIDDIKNIIDIIDGSLNSEAEGLLTFAGYGKVKVSDRTNVQLATLEQRAYVGQLQYIWGEYVGDVEIKHSVNAVYRADNSTIGVLAQLGLTNPLAVAWELVPFSFVVDWVLPIGGWLSSLQADAGLELIQYSESQKLILNGNVEVDITDRNGYSVGNPPTYQVINVTNRHEIPFKMETFRRRETLATEIPPMPKPQLSFSELLQPWKLVTSLSLFQAIK